MRKLFTCWSLFTLLLAGVGVETLSAQDKSEWKTWSEKDANKIIKKAYTAAMPGFFSMMKTATKGALVGVGSLPITESVWLTDDVCWASARLKQIRERRTNDEVIRLHAECREKSDESYALFISSDSLLLLSGYGHTRSIGVNDIVDLSNLGRMFLQHKKNPKKNFIRASDAILSRGLVSGRVTGGTGVTAFFPRNDEFVKGQKDIQLELVQGKTKLKMKFKLKNLIQAGNYKDL